MIAVLAAHIWQSTLFAGAAALLAFALRRNGAAVRYIVWLTASAKFLVPFSLMAALARWIDLREPIASGETILTLQALASPVPPLGGAITTLFIVIWAGGAAIVSARRIFAWSRLLAAIRAARPLSLDTPIPARTTPTALEPGVAGFFHPVLLLPEDIARRLSPVELNAVLAHELCHWRRRDNLTAALHMITEALFWFHPVVWWIGAKLIDERERACDEHVLAAGNDAEAYAESILKVCRLYLTSPLACAPGVSGADLKNRIENILANRGPQSLGPAKRLLLAAAAAAVLTPLAAVWLGFTEVMLAPRTGRDETGRVISPRADPAHPNTGAREIYPADSRALGEQGSLVLLLTVEKTGTVSNAVTETGSGYTRLDDAALTAAASWRFLPGTVDGAPKAMRMPIRVTFRLPPP